METIISKKILSTFDQLEKDSLDLHTLFEFVEDGADYYSRTESGRLIVAGPREITMYTREGCHLCDEAKTAMTPLLAEFNAKLREVDIDDDPILLERYNDDVPVIFVGALLFAQHRIDPALLRHRLEQTKDS
jgi:glutaredoxin